MAQQLAPRMTTPSVCSQFPYAEFLPLKSFAPAETFCSLYLAQSKLPPISGCPKGNALCSILSRLSQCDRDFISTVWYVKPAISVNVRLTYAIVNVLNRDQR